MLHYLQNLCISIRLRYLVAAAAALSLISAYLFWRPDILATSRKLLFNGPKTSSDRYVLQLQASIIIRDAQNLIDRPLNDTELGEMRRRVRAMKGWVNFKDHERSALDFTQKEDLETQVASAILSAFPFLRTFENSQDSHPFKTVRERRHWLKRHRRSRREERFSICLPPCRRSTTCPCASIANPDHVRR